MAVKVLPSPSSLSAVISPFMRQARRLATDSPSPVPVPYLLGFLFSCAKVLKRLGMNELPIPQPSSFTMKVMW